MASKGSYSSARGRFFVRHTLSLVRYKLQNQDNFADVKVRSFERIKQKLETHLARPVEGLDMLEVGCGQWLANVKLFGAMGNRVCGIDPEVPPHRLFGYLKMARQCGTQRAFKTLANEIMLRRRFDARLSRQSGLRLPSDGYQLYRVPGERVPLPDNSIDCVISDNVFEHIPDVPGVVKEIRRVLRPGGLAVIVIHPYTAFSGNHNLELFQHAEGDAEMPIPPWDHLREGRFPSGVYLNKLRLDDYRRAFEAELATQEWELLGPEGEEHLTEEILRELPQYTREELLVGKIVYVGRKPAP